MPGSRSTGNSTAGPLGGSSVIKANLSRGRRPRQEELLKDAREWAKPELRQIVSEIRDVPEIKEHVVKKTWDQFVKTHRDYDAFQLGYRAFASALWEEGSPSLADLAKSAIEEIGGVLPMRLEPAPAPEVKGTLAGIEDQHSGAEPGRKRRGRKAKFTPEQLDRARLMKSGGETNNQIAKVLYGATPTAAQRRSVSTTLRHHFGAKK